MATATDQFTKLPTSTKLILGGLILLLTAAAYYSLLHSDLTDAIEQQQRDQVRLQDDLQAQQRLQREFVRLREELEARKTTDQENLRALPEKAEMATFLQELNRLAELSGLDIKTVRPGHESKEKFYVRIPVQLAVTGRFHQLAKFFHNVSRLQRAINIGDISISRRGSKAGEEITLNVDLSASTYRRAGGKS